MFTTVPEMPETIMGYLRSDGRAGLRNHLVVLSTVALTNRWAELIVAGFSPTAGNAPVLISGDYWRGLRGADVQLQHDTLAAMMAHPNTGACLVLVHDIVSATKWREAAQKLDRPVTVLALMDMSGMQHAVGQGKSELSALEIARQQFVQTPCAWSKFTIGLECGGSDPTSGVAGNPAVGIFVDRMLAAGGTIIVSETAEFLGAEAVVQKRTPDAQNWARINGYFEACERRFSEDGESYRGVNPTAENIEGGLSTLTEKSMGAVCKTGSAPFAGGLDFGEKATGAGLWFMDTPFFSPASLNGMVAGGAVAVLFVIGVFNPCGHELAPTLKICANARTTDRWSDAVDVNLSSVITGHMSLEEAGQHISDALRQVSLGHQTAAEKHGERSTIIPYGQWPL